MKAALVVVDMQEDFCEPHGSLAVKDGRSTAPAINELLDWTGFVVKVGTRDYHPRDHISFASGHPGTNPFTSSHTIKNPENESETQTTLLWPDHCVQDTPGVELIPELHKNKLTHVVDKGMDNRVESYSAFGPPFRKPAVAMSDLNETLQSAGVTHVFSVGLAYDFCVKATAIDAAEHGYKSYVIEDATKAVMQGEEDLAKTKSELVSAGVEVIGLDSDVLKEVRK